MIKRITGIFLIVLTALSCSGNNRSEVFIHKNGETPQKIAFREYSSNEQSGWDRLTDYKSGEMYYCNPLVQLDGEGIESVTVLPEEFYNPGFLEKLRILRNSGNDDAIPLSEGFDFPENTPVYMMDIQFTPSGSKELYSVTKNLQNKMLAIVVDYQVYMAARVTEPVSGGKLRIRGGFHREELVLLAMEITGDRD